MQQTLPALAAPLRAQFVTLNHFAVHVLMVFTFLIIHVFPTKVFAP